MKRFLLSLVAFCFLAAGAFAQDKGTLPAGIDLQFIGCTSNTSDLTTYTLAAHAVGEARDNRKTIIGIMAEDTLTIWTLNTVTVGGASADIIAENTGNASAATMSGWAIIDNPSGTSEDLVFTYSEPITGMTACVWAGYGMTTTVPVHYTVNSSGTGANITTDNNGHSNAVMTSTCWTNAGSGGHTPNVVDGFTAVENVDTTTAEYQYSASTGRVGMRQGITQYQCDAVDANPSIISTVWWRNGTEPRGYQVVCTGSDSDLTTYTLTNIPVGAPAANRMTVLGAIAEDSATNYDFNSGTVGGAATTEITETSTVGLTESAIHVLANNSAADHEDIAFTMSEAITALRVCVYALYNLDSATATGSVSNASATAASMSGDITCAGGGVGLAYAGSDQTGVSTTWSGNIMTSNPGFSSAENTLGFAFKHHTPGATWDVDTDFAGATDDTAISSACWR